jgi:hypothetical protein
MTPLAMLKAGSWISLALLTWFGKVMPGWKRRDGRW